MAPGVSVISHFKQLVMANKMHTWWYDLTSLIIICVIKVFSWQSPGGSHSLKGSFSSDRVVVSGINHDKTFQNLPLITLS